MPDYFAHPTAEIAANAIIGAGAKIWMNAQVREDTRIGENCIIGRNVYIDKGAQIGNNCKIQNNAMIFAPVEIHNGVFIGPGATLTNDKIPRAVNPDETFKSGTDWHAGKIEIGCGASIGAGAIVLTDLIIGEWAMVAAGALVTKNVPPFTLVVGIPARPVGYICKCGRRLELRKDTPEWFCQVDKLRYSLAADEQLHPTS